MEIIWLDGKGCEGQFVVEIMFSDGGTGYMKSPTHDGACEDYEFFWRVNPEIVGMTLYNTEWKPLATKTRMGVAA